MRNKKLVGIAIVTLLTTLTLLVTIAAADQSSGTWSMNAEKSKYSPGPHLGVLLGQSPDTATPVSHSERNISNSICCEVARREEVEACASSA